MVEGGWVPLDGKTGSGLVTKEGFRMRIGKGKEDVFVQRAWRVYLGDVREPKERGKEEILVRVSKADNRSRTRGVDENNKEPEVKVKDS